MWGTRRVRSMRSRTDSSVPIARTGSSPRPRLRASCSHRRSVYRPAIESSPATGQDAEDPRAHAGALEDQPGEGQQDRRGDVAAHQAAPLLGALAEHARVPGAGGAERDGHQEHRDEREGPRVRAAVPGPGAEADERAQQRADTARTIRSDAATARANLACQLVASATLPGCPGPSSSQIRMKPGAVGSGSTNGGGSPPAARSGGVVPLPPRHRLRRQRPSPASRRCRSGRSCPRARCRSSLRPCSERRDGPALGPRPGRPTSLVARAEQWSSVAVGRGHTVRTSGSRPISSTATSPCTASALAADRVLHTLDACARGQVACSIASDTEAGPRAVRARRTSRPAQRGGRRASRSRRRPGAPGPHPLPVAGSRRFVQVGGPDRGRVTMVRAGCPRSAVV